MLSRTYRFLVTVILCQCILVSSSEYKPYDILYSSDTGMITQGLREYNESLSVSCLKRRPLSESFSPINRTNFKHLSIFQCILPPNSFIEEFETLNIDITGIESLHINFNNIEEALPAGNYTAGLKIEVLNMNNDEGERDIFINASDFLEPLTKVTRMYISGIVLPPIPDNMPLESLTLAGDASISSWGDCSSLKTLSIDQLDIGSIPEWPSNCSKLSSLQIDGLLPVKLQQVVVSMSAVAGHLTDLKITGCRIQNLPIVFLEAAKYLKSLDLSDNNLYDESFNEFPVFPSLKTLNVGLNYLQGYIKPLLTRLENLEELNLANNNEFISQCFRGERISPDMAYLQMLPLEKIIFTGTGVDLECFDKAHFSNLKYLDLSSTSSTIFYFSHLPTSDTEELVLNLGRETFAEYHFNETDYQRLSQKNNETKDGRIKHNKLTLKLAVIPCDCLNGWLVRAVRDFPNLISMPDTVCEKDYGNPILEERPEFLECIRVDYSGCKYRKSWSTNEVVAECERRSYNHTLPEVRTPVHGYNVSGYGLENIPPKLPDMLKWIDLRRNRISRLNADKVAMLFKGGRRVWLGDNLLDCDCDNSVLINAIHEHSDQIEDYANLTCVGSGVPLSTVSVAKLCQNTLKALLGIVGILAGLFFMTAFIWRHHGEKIRMYLYARGLCLPCLRINDVDDKPFDAFLSYAHGDEKFVIEHLLPGLENAPEQFRVCVHYRDWQIGEWIPAQIMKSVSLSKRTIIVLSKNFVLSTWSALEFRFAVANAVQAGRAHVLILVLDDVLDLPLDSELKAYIAYNTYLRCDDPLFWDKLRYAMPHKIHNKGSKNSDIQMRENNFPSRDLDSNVIVQLQSIENPLLIEAGANVSQVTVVSN